MAVRYDPLVVDDYLAHLASLSKQRRCIAAQDIRNQFGVLLIKKGTVISPQIAARIQQHQLETSVDSAIELENALNDRRLFDAFHLFFAGLPPLWQIHTVNNFDVVLLNCCQEQMQHRELLQKLTVLQEQFPAAFSEALFCAWFSALLCHRKGDGSDTVVDAFSAGLFSNLGLLHIPAQAAQMPQQFPDAYQTYPLISSLIMKASRNFSDAALLGANEHHEKLLGEGFPLGKDVDHLSPLGLVTSTATNLYRLLNLLPDDQLGNLTVALPGLRVNYALHPNPVFSAALQIINTAQLPPVWQDMKLDLQDFNGFLLQKAVLCCQLSAAANLLFNALRGLDLSDKATLLVIKLQRALSLLHATGVSNLETIEVLSDGFDAPQLGLDEMLEFDLMQADFFDIMAQLHNRLEEVLPKESLVQECLTLCREQLGLIADTLQALPHTTYLQQLRENDVAVS